MDTGGLTQKGAYTFKHDLRNLLLDIQKKMLHGFGNIHWGYALKTVIWFNLGRKPQRVKILFF